MHVAIVKDSGVKSDYYISNQHKHVTVSLSSDILHNTRNIVCAKHFLLTVDGKLIYGFFLESYQINAFV